MLFDVKNRASVVRARAALRLGLAGGGTDLSPFCDEYGGAVLNCTIERYAYAFIAARADGKLVFAAKDLGRSESFHDPASAAGSELALHRGVYLRMMADYNQGRLLPLTVTTTVDAPMGSGLGSSSALVVALVDAFRHLLDPPLGPYEVVRLVFEIERVDLGLSGGKQDHCAAAFGDANFIDFRAGDRVIVNPLRMPIRVLNELESCMVTAFTGQPREHAVLKAAVRKGKVQVMQEA